MAKVESVENCTWTRTHSTSSGVISGLISVKVGRKDTIVDPLLGLESSGIPIETSCVSKEYWADHGPTAPSITPRARQT